MYVTNNYKTSLYCKHSKWDNLVILWLTLKSGKINDITINKETALWNSAKLITVKIFSIVRIFYNSNLVFQLRVHIISIK